MKIDIDDKTTQTINELAAINGTPPSVIIARALEKDAQYWREYEEDMSAIEHYRKTGEHINHEAMNTKFDTMIENAKTLAAKLDE